MDYVKDGTLTIQARTIEEVNSIDRVVVYADGCEREFLLRDVEWEWCHDCKEYDQERHCCHRWSNTIRKTVSDLEEFYGKYITKTEQTLIIDYLDTDDIKTIIVLDDEGFTRVFEERRNDEPDIKRD